MDTAKEKMMAKENPSEVYKKKPTDSLVSEADMVEKSAADAASEPLRCGYDHLEADLDPFDNERNVTRMVGSHGPKHKAVEPQGEEY